MKDFLFRFFSANSCFFFLLFFPIVLSETLSLFFSISFPPPRAPLLPPRTSRMGNLCSRIEVAADDLYSRVRSLVDWTGSRREERRVFSEKGTGMRRQSKTLSLPHASLPLSPFFLSFSPSISNSSQQPWRPDGGDATKHGRRSDGGYEVKKMIIEGGKRANSRRAQRRSPPCDVVSLLLSFSFRPPPFFLDLL